MNKHDLIKKFITSGTTYTVQNNALCFLPGDHKPSTTAGSSLLGKIQDRLKRIGWLYYSLVKLFKPVWKSKEMSDQLKAVLGRFQPGAFILNLGSGPKILNNRADIINVGLYAFNEVDMIADAENIPMADGSTDLILNQAMLEHVTNPEGVIKEMHRLLRSGGEVFCYLPFIVPFHAAPHDFFRWTKPGVREMFSNFDTVKIGIGAGPTSGMLWAVQEWLAIVLSLGSRRLHDIIFIVIMVLTSPIKILDLILVQFPYADKIASGFYIVAKKEQ